MPNRTIYEIGNAIKTMRERRHMTQSELAERMCELTGGLYTGNQIGKWERGVHQITFRDAGVLSDALDCSLFAFMSVSEDRQDEWLTSEERKIMLYGVSKWDGDIHSAIHILNMYMCLPAYRRSDVVNACISEYEQALRNNEVTEGTVPVNKSLIMKSWRKL